MGVIHKLEPEIIDFILARKNTETNLSCRQISGLIQDKFQVNVSKSSVNTVIKNAGLSMPIGRRHKKLRHKKILPAGVLMPIVQSPLVQTVQARPKEEIIAPGVQFMLLQAADYLITGNMNIGVILENGPDNFKDQLETLLRNALDKNRQARCIKLAFLDTEPIYIDSQLHTIWATPHIPYSFSLPAQNIKNRVIKINENNSTLTLFMTPGYDCPTKEFFECILGLNTPDKENIKLTLVNHRLEEIEHIPLSGNNPVYLSFGLWPWQFGAYRKINHTGEFKLLAYPPIQEKIYVADIEMQLSQPKINRTITLRGAALKTNLEEKTILTILTNAPKNEPAEKIAEAYLALWPNMAEGFRDYSRKTENFVYKPVGEDLFPPDKLPPGSSNDKDPKTLLRNYLELLDLFSSAYILPEEYRHKGFNANKEKFYDLKVVLSKNDGIHWATFQTPAGYAYTKDLEYACRRLNERFITLPNGNKLWFKIS